jgi:hypothetical protein
MAEKHQELLVPVPPVAADLSRLRERIGEQLLVPDRWRALVLLTAIRVPSLG